MSLGVFLVVLFAAFLHALWNAMVKGGVDKQVGMIAVVLGHVPIALCVLPFVNLPAVSSWPWLLASMLLHTGYQLFLLSAYRIGDLTQVYPIARGSAPLLVALVSITFLGVVLSGFELLAIAIIAIGIISISLVRQEGAVANHRAAILAGITGCFIASYSLVDGMGARVAGSSVGFYSVATTGNAVIFLLCSTIMRKGVLADTLRYGKKVFLIGGGASFIAYALVVWAFTQAPIPSVTALRETSIVFALLIGTLHLKEPFSLAKFFSVMTTLLGAALLRFAR